jgi:dipeptidyl aminopeptidase/acylaminoacyl peptidase
MNIHRTIFVVFLTLFLLHCLQSQQTLTFKDVMKFEELRNPVISGDGAWVAFGVWPERGDGEVRIKEIDGRRAYTIERGERPQLTSDGNWAAALVQPPFVEARNAKNDKPTTDLSLIYTGDGSEKMFRSVRNFEFSNNSRWLIIHHLRPEELEDHAKKNNYIGAPVTLFRLGTDNALTIDFVNEAAIDSTGEYFVYGVVDTTGESNGFYAIDLRDHLKDPLKILGMKYAYYTNFTWDNPRSRVAFTVTVLDTAKEHRPLDAAIVTWNAFDGEPETIIHPDDIREGYRLRVDNNLRWTRDGERIYFGLMLNDMVLLDEKEEEPDSLTLENLYDIDFILKDVDSDVWHWDDPLIKTNERRTWNRHKNHLYTAVYHIEEDRIVQLATVDLPEINTNHNPHTALATSHLPYSKLITWDGRFNDIYAIDITTGERTLLIEKSRFNALLSPGGTYVAYFFDGDWFLYDTRERTRRNLTENIGFPFDNEDHDLPMSPGPYGVAGWTEHDQAVLIYDKYDIWYFNTQTEETFTMTNGRQKEMIYRIIDRDPDREAFQAGENVLLRMFHDRRKNYGFFRAEIGKAGVMELLGGNLRYDFIQQAANSDRILFTQQRYDMFPNLWVIDDISFRNPRQITHLHEDLTQRFAWGRAELIEWLNIDGNPVQGVVIYPGNFQEGTRYPVMVYFYERFSQRLHDFNHPYTNHRPVFAQYASDGYIVFLPDIWFDVPIPGYSATKNLVPGVKKLIETGLADPDAIGLHGHSWSGYLTAYVITQTDIFAAAVAGAPVSNMTSAYSGIRGGTGLARQFQYEQAQSRLGVSLWENRAPYIENSPVFYADRITTPLLIQFGDEDEAVPWEQGIELYLALRRLEKEAVFLQYHNEPHHLQKFANRLDYAIKMKEYFDHYLKGTPAPEWITAGVPYTGD